MRAAFVLTLLIVGLVPTWTYAQGDERFFNSPSLGVTASWPPELIRVVPPKSPGAAQPELLLRAKDGNLPTFNILQVPGIFDRLKAAESVADSYHSVGLTDAIVERSSISPQGWPLIELSFKGSDGTQNSSVVAVIQRREAHLILTFIDAKDRIAADRPLLEAIFSSIKLSGESETDPMHSGAAQPTPGLWVVLAVAALVAGSLTWFMYHRRRP